MASEAPETPQEGTGDRRARGGDWWELLGDGPDWLSWEGRCRTCGYRFSVCIREPYPKGPGDWGPVAPATCPRCGPA